MGRGILKAQLRDFDRIGKRADREIQPQRREKYDLKYDYADAFKSAYGLFFLQHPSMLNLQQELKRTYNRSNAETVLDVREIPGNNQITRLLDNLEPEWCAETFTHNLKLAEQYGALETFFEGLRFSFRRFLHESWEGFLIFSVMNRTGNVKLLAAAQEFRIQPQTITDRTDKTDMIACKAKKLLPQFVRVCPGSAHASVGLWFNLNSKLLPFTEPAQLYILYYYDISLGRTC
jgi:hypothetical protein